VDYYNLDAIISVGYRINSLRGTEFFEGRACLKNIQAHFVNGLGLVFWCVCPLKSDTTLFPYPFMKRVAKLP
jgi:hypothetical protein